MVIGLSLAAACCYAVASVVQQRVAAAVPAEYSMTVGLLARLVRRPLWLLGVATDLSGFGFEAVALGVGALTVVQPLLVLGLPVALAIGAASSHQHLGRREWLATAALTAGLMLFLAVSDPGRGRELASARRWLLGGGLAAGVVVLCLLAARAFHRHRAALLAAGAGVVFAVSAALTKSTVALVDRDLLATLGHWEPYALAGVGALDLLLAQSAFQAGELRQSLPVLTLVPPFAALALGSALFGETVHATALTLPLEVGGTALAIGGVLALGRSPLAAVAYAGPDPAPER